VSSSKQRTTTAKRVREARLRERRAEKKAKKDARKYAREHDVAGADSSLGDGEVETPVSTPPSDPAAPDSTIAQSSQGPSHL
jgi:hypothetical protein